MQKPSLVAWILLAVLSLIWGSSFILIKRGLLGLHPEELGSLRIITAALVLIPFAVRRFVRKGFMRKGIYLLASGLLGSLIPSFLFAIAQTRLESAITGVINALVPLFTILISLVVFGQKQTKTVYIGMITGFLGTTIVITARGGGLFSNLNSYALLVVLATLCYSLNLILIKKNLNELPPLTVTSISIVLVTPFAIIYLFVFTDFWLRFSHGGVIYLSVFYVSILGVLGTAIALIIFNRILQLTSPLFTSSVTYIIPVIAIIWGVLDGESIYTIQYLGIMAIGMGIYLANSNRSACKKPGNIR